MAAHFDRPPRVLKRYSDCELPLDMNEDEICDGKPELDEALRRLDLNGWNSERRYNSTTWARKGSIITSIKEEILEYSFRPMSDENQSRLR